MRIYQKINRKLVIIIIINKPMRSLVSSYCHPFSRSVESID